LRQARNFAVRDRKLNATSSSLGVAGFLKRLFPYDPKLEIYLMTHTPFTRFQKIFDDPILKSLERDCGYNAPDLQLLHTFGQSKG